MPMDETELIVRLAQDRGDYKKVARDSGVNYQTIIKIAGGHVKRPYGRTMTALARYYAAKDSQPGSVTQ